MKPLVLLLAASTLHFNVTDGRGKKASGVAIEAGDPDDDDWYRLTLSKSKGDAVLVWPMDSRAKMPDGPEPIPVTVIQRGDAKALTSAVAAQLAAPVVLGLKTLDGIANETGFDAAALTRAFAALPSSEDPFEKGIGLLYAKKPADAADFLARGLRDRERRLTRVPSEIFPAAVLSGKALLDTNRFNEAAVVLLKALKQRPSDELARTLRAAALEKAGKPDAAEQLKRRNNWRNN